VAADISRAIGDPHDARSQLAAFTRDDGMAAIAYAAPAIEQKLHTPDQFRSWCAPAMPRYRTGGSSSRSRIIEGFARAAGADRRSQRGCVPAYYTMKQQPDGRWLIAGCMLRRHSDQPA
jgi:Domain of unknown function (DUF4864)